MKTVGSIVAQYLVAFLALGIPFGLLTGIGQHDAQKGMAGGIAFGAFMSLVLVTASVIKSGGRSGVLPRASATAVEPLDRAWAAYASRIALHRLNARPVAYDGLTFRAHTKTGLWTWGELVSVQLAHHEAGTGFTVRSTPRMPLTVIDYGINRRNVDRIITTIREVSHGQNPSHA